MKSPKKINYVLKIRIVKISKIKQVPGTNV